MQGKKETTLKRWLEVLLIQQDKEKEGGEMDFPPLCVAKATTGDENGWFPVQLWSSEKEREGKRERDFFFYQCVADNVSTPRFRFLLRVSQPPTAIEATNTPNSK